MCRNGQAAAMAPKDLMVDTHSNLLARLLPS